MKLILLLFVFMAAAWSQSTAAIQGIITDASGARVPNASVTIRNEGTAEQRNVTTDEAGNYLASSLSLGTYRVEVKATGMQTMAAANLVLEVGRTVQQDFTLKPASTSEVVEIVASAPVIETGTVSVGQVIDQKTVQEIPLNGRHFVDLGLLIPGTVTPPANGFLTAPLRGQGSFGLNTAGNREDTVNFMINGINLNDPAQNQITFQPSINTVQEFKIDNSTYAAEYGRNSGAIVNIATRSGSNQWHGEAFEYLRNNALDARNYFNVKPVLQSPFKRNQFGAAAGGPVRKDKTFFFLSYEGLRQRQGLTINQTVLSDTQRAAVQSGGNATTQKLLAVIPAANAAGSKFIGSATAPVNIDQGTANVSHSFGSNDRVNFYYALQHDLRQEPTLQGNNIPGFGDTRESRRQIFTFNETHVASANIVNEVRLGFNRIHIVFAPNNPLNPADFGMNIGVNTAIGLPQITLRDIGLNLGGPGGFPQGRGDLTAVLSDTLSYIKGAHAFKFGGEYRRQNNNNFGTTPGTFAFNTVADFTAGNAATFTANPTFNPNRLYANALGLFLQDNWKVRKNLTLDLGLRWDWNATPTEAQNRLVTFNETTGALVRVGTNGLDRVYGQNAKNFEPRVGLAWDIAGNHKTVFRMAYAIQADQPVFNLVSPMATNPPFANPVTFNGPGFVTFANAITAAQAAGSLSPTAVDRNYRNANVQSWNANLQQQLFGDVNLTIGYYANKGTHLRTSRNVNQFLPGTSTRPYPKVAADSAIAPGAGLGNVNVWESTGNSLYNGLWVTATKRFSRGLQFNTSYTWSKSIDYTSLNSAGNASILQDNFNVRGDRGLSDFDARHRWVMSGIYDLPFKANRLVEGWQFATIVQLQTGNPVNIVTSNGTLTGVANTVRPDVAGPVAVGLQPAGNGNLLYFNPAQFIVPPPTRFGNLGRNVVTGPGFQNIDLSLLKNTKVTERVTAQFRADVFDLFNHPNFGQPNRIVSFAAGNTFGQITSTRFPVGDSGSSRQIQLALKLIF